MEGVFYFEWEMVLIKWFQSFESGFLNIFSNISAMLGEEMFLVLVVGFCYWSINKDLGRKVSLSLVGTLMGGTLIKCAVKRSRPYMVDSDIKCIRAAHPDEDIMSLSAQGYSFPSLHSCMSSGTYATIAVEVKKRFFTILAFVLPLIIGVTRVYLGVHFPTDVLAGWLLGLIVIAVLLAVEKKWGYKTAFIVLLVICLPGFFYCKVNDFYTGYGIVLGMLLGFIFEEKKVQFEMPKTTLKKILRTVFGILLFLAVSTVLKLPIKNLDSTKYEMFLYFYRMFRYGISTFTVLGLYPLTFKRYL